MTVGSVNNRNKFNYTNRYLEILRPTFIIWFITMLVVTNTLKEQAIVTADGRKLKLTDANLELSRVKRGKIYQDDLTSLFLQVRHLTGLLHTFASYWNVLSKQSQSKRVVMIQFETKSGEFLAKSRSYIKKRSEINIHLCV